MSEGAPLKVCREFGGLSVSVPKLDQYHREQRDAGIRAEYDRGSKVAALARKHGLTIRSIYNILNKEATSDL